METLAERLKRLRKPLKLSQAKLAQKAGVSQSAIGMIESGERENPQILVQLAAALGVSVEMLATGKGLEQQRVVMTTQEAELIDQWALLSPPQQLAIQRTMQRHINDNQEVLAAFGGPKYKPIQPVAVETPKLSIPASASGGISSSIPPEKNNQTNKQEIPHDS